MARFCFGEFLKIMTNNIVPSMSQEATANYILQPLLNDLYIGKEEASKLKNQKISVRGDIVNRAGDERDQTHRKNLIAYFKDTVRLHMEKEDAAIKAICDLLNGDTTIPADKRDELFAYLKKDSYSDFLAYTLLYALSVENKLTTRVGKNVIKTASEGSPKNPYDFLFSLVAAIINTTSPDYAKNAQKKDKACPLTRTSFVSLCKYVANEDVDAILSVDYSAEQLNSIVSDSTLPILKEFEERGFCFVESKDTILVTLEDDGPEKASDPPSSFIVLENLFEAYKSERYHENHFSLKKKELNITISEYVRAMAFSDSFKTTEEKSLLISIIQTLIATHNHDSNYMYSVLYDSETKSTPVAIQSNIITECVANYYEDIYSTDINWVYWSNNFLATIKKLDLTNQIHILENLIFERKCFNLTIWKALARITDERQISLLRDYIAKTVFPICQKQAIEESDARQLVAFICMFARGSFLPVCYDKNSQSVYSKTFALTIRYILVHLEKIVSFFPARIGDISQGLANCLLAITSIEKNTNSIKPIFAGIDQNSTCIKEYVFLREVYDLLVFGILPTKSKIDFLQIFSIERNEQAEEKFIAFVKNNYFPLESNPFVQDSDSLVLASYLYLRKMVSGKRYLLNDEIKEFFDKVVTWLIEATYQDPKQQYLLAIANAEYYLHGMGYKALNEKKKNLYAHILKSGKYNLIPPTIIEQVWHPFKGLLASGEDPQLRDVFNQCIDYWLNEENNCSVATFILKGIPFCSAENKVRIIKYAHNLLQYSLSQLHYSQIKLAINTIEKEVGTLSTELAYHVVTDLHTTNLLLTDKLKVLGIVIDKIGYSFITNSLVEQGKNSQYYETFYQLIRSVKGYSWERVYLFQICNWILSCDVFLRSSEDIQLLVLHYTKNKREYWDSFYMLLEDLKQERAFSLLDPKVKTALLLHADDYIDMFDKQYAEYNQFLEDTLQDLCNNSFSHAQIKKQYGLRTDTLIYHIIKIYKAYPEKTAKLCVIGLCKLYKQLISYNIEDAFQSYAVKLINDRIEIFSVYVANPCIRNISTFFCDKIFAYFNQSSSANKLKSLFYKLYQTVIALKRHDWPEWFDISQKEFAVTRPDSIFDNVIVDVTDFAVRDVTLFDMLPDSSKECIDVANWRSKNCAAPFIPSMPIVAYKQQEKYIVLSGYDYVKACTCSIIGDVMPEKVGVVLVNTGSVEQISFSPPTRQVHTVDEVINLFRNLYALIDSKLPIDCRRGGAGLKVIPWLSLKKIKNLDANRAAQKLDDFVFFYNGYVSTSNGFDTPNGNVTKLKQYAPEAYLDYYEEMVRLIYGNLSSLWV